MEVRTMKNQLWHDVRASMLVGGASETGALTLDDVAHGSHVSHSAASSIVASSQSTPTFLDESELDRREEGGALTYDPSYIMAQRARRALNTGSWLTSIDRRWPAKVVS
jgi:hypothetical protein